MKYKHIIFDIDGTLIDTEYAVLHFLQETINCPGERYHALNWQYTENHISVCEHTCK